MSSVTLSLFTPLGRKPLGFGILSLPQLDIRAVAANLNINEFAGFGMATQLVGPSVFCRNTSHLLWV